MDQSTLTLRDYWTIALRRKWLILGCLFLSVAAAAVLCQILPKSYRSDTLILVEDQKIPESYVKRIVGGSVEERLTMIEQQVMSRTLLTQIVGEFELVPDRASSAVLEAAVEELRESIEVTTVGGGRRGPVEAFRISYSHEDPAVAMKVTSRIASKFIQENLRHREQFVEGASEFLDSELRRAKEELELKEREISEFKSTHMGGLPEQMEVNLRTLDRIQAERSDLHQNIQRMADQVNLVERGIDEYVKTGNASAEFTAAHGEPDLLLQRYRELDHKVSSLSAEYTPSYPDVVLAKQEFERIKEELAGRHGRDYEKGNEKVFDPYLVKLEKRRDELNLELSYLKKRQRSLIKQRRDYEQRVEQAPALEQQLLILHRDYGNMKNNYSVILDKRLSARVAENLEKRQKGEQFRIIDPANLPTKAEKPDQKRIMLIGFLGGCGLGFGLVWLLEMLNPTFRRPEEIELQYGLQVLATIPDFGFLYRGGEAHGGQWPEQASPPRESSDAAPIMRGLRTLGDRWSLGRKSRSNKKEPLVTTQSLVTKWRPTSVVAEQYRVAATKLALLDAGRGTTVVVVTSAVKGEGKTTTSLNLAYTLARDLGKRTLVIDADLKSPALHLSLDVPGEPGLADVLKQNAPMEACLSRIGEIPLWILPVGHVDNQSTQLLKAHELSIMLNNLRARFDYILVDAPPIMPLADMNILGGLADVLTVVIRADSTPRDVVQRSLSSLRVVTQPQIILNAVETTTMPYYMYYNYQTQLPEKQHV